MSSPCNFNHPVKNLNVTVHGDDFAVIGPLNSIKWFQAAMRKKYDINTETLGPDVGSVKEVKCLSRVIRWCKHGAEYEPDIRHAELIVRELGLKDAKAVATPGTYDSRKHEAKDAEGRSVEGEDAPMHPEDATKYRGIAARLNYLAMDRSDVQFAAKECCKHMSAPKRGDWEKLKRAGQYLKGRPRMVQQFVWNRRSNEFDGFGDSDWAGCKTTLKSTSGGIIFWGKSLLKSWSSSQSTVSLSSGEAELYALTKLSSQVLGMISLAEDFGVKMTGKVKTDSSAAMGIAYRNGIGGRARHIRVQYLWIQGVIEKKDLTLEKVDTKLNVADVLTKHLAREPYEEHVRTMGFRHREGRAGEAVSLDEVREN